MCCASVVFTPPPHTPSPPSLFRRYEKLKDDAGASRKWKDKGLAKMVSLTSIEARSLDESDGSYFAWHLKVSSTRQNLMIFALIAVVLIACLFQIWPLWARTIVWYISVTILLFILAVIVIQLILFALVWPFGWDFWLLPNFTSDTAPIWDLFNPIYTLDKSAGSHPTARVTVILVFVAAIVFVIRLPPSDFNEFMSNQRKIVDDLYSGALLTDGREGGEGGLTTQGRYNNPLNPFGSKWGPGSGRYGSMRAAPIPKLDDLEKSLENDEKDAFARDASDSSPEADLDHVETHHQSREADEKVSVEDENIHVDGGSSNSESTE